MKCLIFGTGSIGRRHLKNILGIDPSVEIYAFRKNKTHDNYSKSIGAVIISSLDEISKLSPDYSIIATPSHLHIEPLISLLEQRIPIYIEKPVVTTSSHLNKLKKLIEDLKVLPITMVGCNLRSLDSIKILKKYIDEGKIGNIVRANLEVGQWLPSWRSDVDYRNSYSVDKETGGGVILDLIHEIDMARWLFGEFSTARAIAGKYSSLEINSEDTACILLKHKKGNPAVTISMDYVSRIPVRHYRIVGDRGSLIWNLATKSLSFEGEHYVKTISTEKDFDIDLSYYTSMNKFLSAVRMKQDIDQNLLDGIKTLELTLIIKENIL